jgi:hypothetical protein
MRFTRSTMPRASLTWLLALAACLDGTGPRARPGTTETEPPPEAARLLWFETQPRVITQGSSDSIDLNVAVSAATAAVRFQPRTGTSIALQRVSESLYAARLSPATLLFGYRTGDLHQAVGILEVVGADQTEEHIMVANVKDASVPTVNVSTLAAGVQATDHVLNIRHDALNPGAEVAAAVLHTLYDHFADDYTFVAVIEQVDSPTEPFFVAVRNSISGLGLAPLDHGATYGSAASLEGIIHYPRQSDFDLAETDDIHELAHRWISYSTEPSLIAARPHWPLSSLAYGIMGWQDPVTDAALPFPFEITRQSDGTHLLRTTDRPRSFNDLELYFMGLLSADSVRTHFVFANQNQRAQVTNNGILAGGVDSLRIGDIIARDGERVPSAATAPREFRIATVVLSRGGMLSRDEMSFFEYMAARGEQRVALPSSDGLIRGTTLPFFIATGGRAALVTRLRTSGPI